MNDNELVRRFAELFSAYEEKLQSAAMVTDERRTQLFNDMDNYMRHMVAQVGGECEVETMGENGGITVKVPVFDPATPEELAAFKVILLHASAITIDSRADGDVCISITIPDIRCAVEPTGSE